jgi:hypothetical protein
MSGDHLITTKTRVTTHRCGRIVFDAIVEGLPVHADPTPLTPIGELAALLAGRRTYDLARRELWHRDRWRICRREHPVVADHRCGIPPPPAGHVAPVTRRPFPADPTDPPY